jgi:signal transduction histidine kinase
MDWSNWIYLTIGLALGVGLRGLLSRPKPLSELSTVSQVPKNEALEHLQQIKQMQLAYQLVEEMSQFKAGFLARTTHVLRSPLNGLIGLHQLILSDLCESPEEEREFIAQAHDRAMKLLKLIDEILNIARTESATNRLNIQPQSLGELLEDVYDLTYMLAENRNYPFEVIVPSTEIYVLVDPRWLRQVLINLVETAITQMEIKMEEGKICISVQPEIAGNYACILVDIPSFAFPSSEAVDLMTVQTKQNFTATEQDAMEAGMKLLFNQTVIEVLGGKLAILPHPKHDQLTRYQILIPQMIPEVELVPLQANQG